MEILMARTATEEDLDRLERDIRQLKIEYEQYFGGGRKRPPTEVEWRIEQLLKRYGDRTAEMGYGQRFRYSNLSQTYVKYREIFHKKMQSREEGKVQRHFGAAAKAIEAERARKEQSALRLTVSCSDPAREPDKVEQLYNAFRHALEASGEPPEALSRESFERFLLKKADQLRARTDSPEIEFAVLMENGKARLKARRKT
jgi:hypothetical protein